MASATSCEPSSWTPARPSATAGIAPGSPPPSTTPYGDRLVGVPPAASSSATVGEPRPGHERDARRRVVGGEQRLELARVVERLGQRVDDPARVGVGDGEVAVQVGVTVGRDLSRPRRGVMPAHLAQDGVDQSGRAAADAGAHEVDARRDRGMVGHPHREQLVDAQAQHVAYLGLELGLGEAGVDDRVVEALHRMAPDASSVAKRGVASLEPVLARDLGQDEVGVGVVGPDRGEHVEGCLAGAVDARTSRFTHRRRTPWPGAWVPGGPTPR